MTIQEIAALSGVSPATVSRVFSHQPGIREEIREKVLKLARAHGYHPRFSSRQKNLVIITPQASSFAAHSCVDMLLMALTSELPKLDFRLEILPISNLDRLNTIQFCGAVAIGCEAEDFPEWPKQFAVPLIVVDRSPKGKRKFPELCFVHSDEAQGMALAVEHLLAGGCKKIGCIIHGTPERGNALLRRNAIEAVLAKHRQSSDPRLICYSGDGDEKYVELIGKMLKNGADSLFCPGGNAGILSLYALSLYEKKIPDDVSLIASEQTAFSCFTTPPQTTLSPDYAGLAARVAEVLMTWMNNDPLPPDVVLPYRLIVRESTRPVGENSIF